MNMEEQTKLEDSSPLQRDGSFVTAETWATAHVGLDAMKAVADSGAEVVQAIELLHAALVQSVEGQKHRTNQN